MKKIILSSLIIFLSLSNHAQSLIQDSLTVHFLNRPMTEFLDYMQKESELEFVYKNEWLNKASITVNQNDKPISYILTKAFQLTPFTFVFIDPNLIILVEKDNFVNQIPYYNDEIQRRLETTTDNSNISTKSRYLRGRQPDEKKNIRIGSKSNMQFGRKANVRIKVIDIENKESLIGATLFIDELKTGAATNINGELSLKLSPGKYSAEFSSIGMANYKCLLDIKSDGYFTLEMYRKIKEIDEVTINAKQNYKIRGSEVGLDRISIKSIKELPTLMGEKDIIKISQMLPGVVSVSEGSAGINVRGGNADQNLFYISDIPLYNTSHLFGFFSAINSTTVKNFSIYKGHVPAKFGGRLSSIFDIETREGNKDRFFAQGGISPISANLSVEGPIVKEKVSYVVSGRSSYSDWILQKMPNDDLKNSSVFFYDFSATVDYDINKNNNIKIFNYYSSDFFNLNKLNEYDYSNLGNGISYFHRFSPRLKSNVSVVNSRYNFGSKDLNNISEAYSHNFTLQHTEAKASLAWIVNQKHSLSLGASSILYNLDRGKVVPYGEESKRSVNDLGKEKAIESALFVDDNFQITKKLKLYAGLRYSFYNSVGPQEVYIYNDKLPPGPISITDTLQYGSGESVAKYNSPEFRFAIDYKLSRFSSLKLSYNEMQQYLFMLSNTYAVSPTDQWKLSDYHIKPAKSKQIAVGFYQNIVALDVSFSSEVYYKTSDNVLEFKDGADFISPDKVETMTLQGNQEAYGAEFMIAKDEGKLNGWISYTYSRSFMEFNGENEWDKINEGKIYPSNFDKPHVLNIVGNYRFNRRIVLSSNILYSTGRPITLPQSIYHIEGMKYADYSDRNEYRIPDYFRLDLSLTIEGNLKANKKLHSSWMFNVYNLTGRKNPYTIYFVSEGKGLQGYQYSIIGVPIFTVSWNFKLGNYSND